MKSFKHLSFVLLAWGINIPVFADSSVLVPSQYGGLKAGIDALYLQANNSDLNYATFVTPSKNVSFLVSPQQNGIIDPSYKWGFYAQIGYLFPSSGNDLTLGYTYLHTEDNNSIIVPINQAPSSPITVLPLILIGEQVNGDFTLFPDSATGKASFDLDTLDLEGGQRFTTDEFDMRMFSGLRYTHLETKFSTDVTGELSTTGGILPLVVANQEFTSTFKGIGPRIGVDGRYCFSSGFGLDAHLSTALLIGKVISSYSAQSQLTDNPDGSFGDPNFNFNTNNTSRWGVVPNVDVKLGVDYTYIMSRGAKSAWSFEIGYQADNYFNGVDHIRVVSSPNNDGASGFDYQNTTSDVGFNGLYAGVKYYA